MKYVCSICGYVYDEDKEGRSFASLPESWLCPLCKAPKSMFAPEKKIKERAAEKAEDRKEGASEQEEERTDRPAEQAGAEERKEKSVREWEEETTGDGLQKLSVGALAALCSSLARGCEKQYKEEESSLFLELSGYFASMAQSEPEGDIDALTELFRKDLDEGYPSVSGAAREAGDRGTQRICVWGEKVTKILYALVSRYQREGTAFLEYTQIWVCSVCSFVFVGDTPPELCPVCKVPSWKFDRIEGRSAE